MNTINSVVQVHQNPWDPLINLILLSFSKEQAVSPIGDYDESVDKNFSSLQPFGCSK